MVEELRQHFTSNIVENLTQCKDAQCLDPLKKAEAHVRQVLDVNWNEETKSNIVALKIKYLWTNGMLKI